MKSIKAFLAALVLFVISAAGIHLFVNHNLPSYGISYGTWIDHSKYGCHAALEKLLDGTETIPVFGSSELRHGQKSGFHADTVFRNSDMEPVFIGEAGYQSLNHAITLGSLGKQLSGKKVVLIVSPQWFKSKGVVKNAFGNSFSEDNFIAFLQNTSISDKEKDNVIKRAKKLTKGNRILYRKVCNDARWYSGSQLTAADLLVKEVHTFLVQYKSQTGLLTRMQLKGIQGGPDNGTQSGISQVTWGKLWQKAQERGEKLSGGNDFGMYDAIYEKVYKPKLESGTVKKPTYTKDSVEFEDLECFLQICQEENIKPLIVMLPFNGYWYDKIGVDSAQRADIYQKVSEITQKYQAAYADLSGNEYDQYYFEDNSHPALEGLVNLNETIYDFYKGDSK